MRLVYSGEKCADLWKYPSIFLAGPTPRSKDVASWRPEALKLLEGFKGVVIIPERRDGVWNVEYVVQAEWECGFLDGCGVVLFWVPRDLVSLPGFTTNVEFGRFVGVKRCVYGRPVGAPKTRYLDWWYRRCTGLEPCDSLRDAVDVAVSWLV
jgi:hypothetical protein